MNFISVSWPLYNLEHYKENILGWVIIHTSFRQEVFTPNHDMQQLRPGWESTQSRSIVWRNYWKVFHGTFHTISRLRHFFQMRHTGSGFHVILLWCKIWTPCSHCSMQNHIWLRNDVVSCNELCIIMQSSLNGVNQIKGVLNLTWILFCVFYFTLRDLVL